MRGGAQRRGLNGAEGAAGFRDHQGEETIHAAPKAPENISLCMALYSNTIILSGTHLKFVILDVSRVRGVPA